MNVKSSFLSSFYKNDIDTGKVNEFLNNYEKQSCGTDEIPRYLQNTKLNHILSNLHSRELIYGNLLDTFSSINLELECDYDSVESDALVLNMSVPDVTSYEDFNISHNQTFSVLDIFSDSQRMEVQRIKRIFPNTYPLLLINSYKYKMISDFYTAVNIDNDFYRIIYKIITLTLLSVVDDIESCNDKTITNSMLSIILEKLRTPPSLEFCKQWMSLHQLSCIFRNMNNNKFIVYNFKQANSDLYIYFEFYSKSIVVLKQVKLTL